jgi:hypothetical protein
MLLGTTACRGGGRGVQPCRGSGCVVFILNRCDEVNKPLSGRLRDACDGVEKNDFGFEGIEQLPERIVVVSALVMIHAAVVRRPAMKMGCHQDAMMTILKIKNEGRVPHYVSFDGLFVWQQDNKKRGGKKKKKKKSIRQKVVEQCH